MKPAPFAVIAGLFFGILTCGAGGPQSMDFYAERVPFQDVTFDVVTLDLRKVSLQTFKAKSDHPQPINAAWVKQIVERQKRKLLAATNGGIFNPGFIPAGLYIEGGKEWVGLNVKEGRGNFYLQPNGVFLIGQNGQAEIYPSLAYLAARKKAQYAIQSGPLLLNKGKIHPAFREGSKNRYIRNGVGIIDEHHVVLVISNAPVNLYTFARFFRDYAECHSALYLDGAISNMYIPSLGRNETQGKFASMVAVVRK
ncbi:MAG: phosphodiester glycosidase family protein [Bacteroidota bacterium]